MHSTGTTPADEVRPGERFYMETALSDVPQGCTFAGATLCLSLVIASFGIAHVTAAKFCKPRGRETSTHGPHDTVLASPSGSSLR